MGLTEDNPPNPTEEDDEMGDNGDGDKGEPIVEPMPRRTSKRLRLVPQPLISDYQCEIAILNRARQTKLVASKLSIILKKPW